MSLNQRFPLADAIEVDELVEELRAEPVGGRLRVGDPRVVEFLTKFARKLLVPATARRFPELASLGFFLRKGEIAKALKTLSTLETSGDALRFPRGLVFHVPPANVDTIFVYSWALSALAGNHNVVRVSSRSAGAAETVLAALNAALSEVDADTAAAITATQRMVTYDRSDAISGALSVAADLRVIWGGDASVAALRKYPLAPHARDLTFPDRSSFAVASVRGWRNASDAERRGAAEGFYNDSYWFDQAACSSPRAVFWVGDEDGAREAGQEFRKLLAEVLAAKQHVTEPAMAVQKRVSAYGAAVDGLVDGIEFQGNGIATLELADPAVLPREWLGAGTFGNARVDTLSDLVPIVLRKDQTVGQFGFTKEELTEFVTELAGRGVDRVVPFGSALTFSAIWDGYDLLTEFSRLVTVQV
ncbi:Acyl-CoA reductase (LuxC) [Amycolatopsis lurida]|uniref:Gamma-glutamyl phosphate reductase n=1 Tax=Amycolatopsis lurida NRRL 2430 TaxID=1460371 RepID=A0A2P2FWR1_AMYLU|nr:acyl-CoA reductase [Amycolatopsis lurida]KFU81142.1 gamma-glutamyl phosphate reductase [Amycolatopsis lurida NRRL 2430]SED55651.1 Acyl-CoA reductase (LuxC) [Amycolatopsis lurida]